MKRFFISCDIEGTCGIAAWDETEKGAGDYAPFAEQMTMEAGAACEGLLSAGAEAIFLRDAHDSARNLRPALLPQRPEVRVFRGWGRDPYGMMSGIDGTYSGALFTGYHSACGWDGNPLSHTTSNSKFFSITLNGEIMPELMSNSLTAAMFGVPVLMVTGDRMLCDWFHTKVPDAVTVPVSEGVGNGSVSIMPQEAVRRIREGAARAAQLDPAKCLFPRPDRYCVDVCFREHQKARGAGWYPGAKQVDSRTVRFASDNWMDVLTFFHFI